MQKVAQFFQTFLLRSSNLTVLWLSPFGEGPPQRGGAGAGERAREAGAREPRKFLLRNPLTRGGRESRLLSCANGGNAASGQGPQGPGENLHNWILWNTDVSQIQTRRQAPRRGEAGLTYFN